MKKLVKESLNEFLNEYSIWDREKEVISELDRMASENGFKRVTKIHVPMQSDFTTIKKENFIRAWEATSFPYTIVALLREPWEASEMEDTGRKDSNFTVIAYNGVWEYDEPYEEFLKPEKWAEVQDLKGVRV